MQLPSSGTKARSEHMLTQQYGVRCVPRIFETTVFVSLMDSVEWPLHSVTSSVADLSPPLNSRVFEGEWVEILLAGYHVSTEATRKPNLDSGLGLSLLLPFLSHKVTLIHSWLVGRSIGQTHICSFTDMSFKIHVPKLFVGRMSMHLIGRTNAACSKFAISMIAELSSPCFPKLLQRGSLPIKTSKRTLNALLIKRVGSCCHPAGFAMGRYLAM